MTQITLTDEQLAVIHHPLGQHARVLAVAGSGKSFTMACRIQHLVQDCNIPPHAIQVLMFNRLARQQFRSHLDRTGLPDVLQPEVHTFHSFSYHVIREMLRIGVLPGLTQFWTGAQGCAHRHEQPPFALPGRTSTSPPNICLERSKKPCLTQPSPNLSLKTLPRLCWQPCQPMSDTS